LDSINQINLRKVTFATTAWLLILPLVGLWPFLSAFPLFSILTATTIDLALILNIFFFVTGFWPLLFLYFLSVSLMYGTIRKTNYVIMGFWNPWIGSYIAIWTIVYGSFAYLFR